MSLWIRLCNHTYIHSSLRHRLQSAACGRGHLCWPRLYMPQRAVLCWPRLHRWHIRLTLPCPARLYRLDVTHRTHCTVSKRSCRCSECSPLGTPDRLQMAARKLMLRVASRHGKPVAALHFGPVSMGGL